MPIRVAGWQPDSDGGVSVYGRTDQVLAGLEAAVDPNGDGDAHDAVRIALVGVVEPFASFPDSPLATAAAGALALDTLVVAPAGNDGPAGPGFGSIAAPGGVPGALGVAASDSRRRSPTVHILLRAGLRVLASGETRSAACPAGGVVTAPSPPCRAGRSSR
jgi:subtilisin family serine protease